jgi:hypothetical protein
LLLATSQTRITTSHNRVMRIAIAIMPYKSI